MRRTALPLLLLLAACTTTYDAPPPAELPVIDVGSLAGQEISIDLRSRTDEPIESGYLREDLQRALEKSGMRVVEQAPLQLRAKYMLVTNNRRHFPWEGCGRLEGQLMREGKAEGRAFTSDYCSEIPAWHYRYPRTRREREAEQAREYQELLRVFLNDLEQAVTTAKS